jgi:branched-subunit amino acid permease
MVEKDSNLVAYVFGIISIVTAFFTPLAGLVFGIIGLVQSNKQKNELSKKAKTLSIIGIILSIILFLALIILTYLGLDSLANLPVA